MKNILKRTLNFVLVAAMMLNLLVGLVFATEKATITIEEQDVNLETGVKKLVFSVKTPTNTSVTTTGLILSYDNTVIQPVNKTGTNDNVDITETTDNGSKKPLKAYTDSEDSEKNFAVPNVMWVVNGDRTAFKYDTYTDGDGFVANEGAGVVFSEFYFKIKDGKIPDESTFMLETDYSEGSVLSAMYTDQNTAATIMVGDDYKYGWAKEGAADTATISSFTYTGSTNQKLGSIELSADEAEVAVPKTYPDAEGDATVTFTAVAKSTLGNAMATQPDITYSISGDNTTGATLSGNVLTVGKSANAGTVSVVATSGNVTSEPVMVEITKEALVATKLVVSGDETIVKPVNAQAADATLQLSAAIYDQYGGTVDDTFTYELGSSYTGVSIEGNTISVDSTAETRDIEVKITGVTNTTMTMTKTIAITSLTHDWSAIGALVEDTIVYGTTNDDAVGTLPANGTANAGNVQVSGTYSVKDAATIQTVGDKTVTVEFLVTTDGPYKNVKLTKDYTVAITARELTVSGIVAENKVYDGTINATINTDDIVLNGLVAQDIDHVDIAPVTGEFASPDVGNGIAVNIIGKVELVDTTAADNYTLAAQPTGLTANITPAVATSIATPAPTLDMTARVAFNSELKSVDTIKTKIVGSISEVTANYGTSSTEAVTITWADATESYNVKGGTYTFVGTPSSNNLTFGDLKLTATATISPVMGTFEAIDNVLVVESYLEENVVDYADLDLPSEITVTYSDETTEQIAVTWNKTIEELKALTAGSKANLTLTSEFPEWATITTPTTIEFEVTDKYPVDVKVTMDGWTYGESATEPDAVQNQKNDGIDDGATFTYTYEGVTLAGEDYGPTTDVPTDAGTYTVTATLVSNTHAGSDTEQFTIAPQEVAVSATVDNAVFNYIDENKAVTVSGYPEDKVKIKSISYKLPDKDTVTAPKEVGTYNVTVVFEPISANYTITEGVEHTTATLEIQPVAPIDAVITTSVGSKKITVTVKSTDNGATTTATITIKIKNDETVVKTIENATLENGVYTVTVTELDDSAELENGTEYTIEATVTNEKGSKAAEPVIATPKATQNTSRPISNSNKLPAGDLGGNDKPSTDKPGTEEPGTEEPGTEEPGTEEPGTEEPSTDEPSTEEPAEDIEIVVDPDEEVAVINPAEEVEKDAETGAIVWENTYEDVKADEWYADAVGFAKTTGLMNGVGETSFAPDATLTRGMFATILYRLVEAPEAAQKVGFKDVSDDAWYADAINWGAKNGIVTGVGAGNFAPDDVVTREQMATMLYRFATLMGHEAEAAALGFADAEHVADWAEEAFAWCTANGIINGVSDTHLAPQQTATRAQAAAVFMRTVEFFNK